MSTDRKNEDPPTAELPVYPRGAAGSDPIPTGETTSCGEGEEMVDRVKILLGSQRFAVLATSWDGRPYGSLIAFAATDDMRHLVFATMRATRKFNNLAREEHVAILIDDRSNRSTDTREATAATATGRAREVTGDERAELEAVFLAKHPYMRGFVGSPGCALVDTTVDTYYVVTRFQSVFELHMAPMPPKAGFRFDESEGHGGCD